MSDIVKEHDFVVLSYTGRLPDGTVFDTTEKTIAEENNMPTEGVTFKTPTICVGERQVLPGLDEDLPGKEISKEYLVTLPAEKAFGKRDIKKMKIVPISTFKEHQVQPQPGLQIDVDGERGTVTRISGGRIIVNFNHPLAGKEVVYKYKIIKKITDLTEKVKCFLSASIGLPFEKMEVKVAENMVEIALPMEIPIELTQLLSKKLSEITAVKDIIFKKQEIKEQ
jgi:FKBP-type peptidyl-prolyl cis-trans isomerase SlyD